MILVTGATGHVGRAGPKSLPLDCFLIISQTGASPEQRAYGVFCSNRTASLSASWPDVTRPHTDRIAAMASATRWGAVGRAYMRSR
jgi:hypothetical protein